MLAATKEDILGSAGSQAVLSFDLDLGAPLFLPDLGEIVAQTEYMAPDGLVYVLRDGKVSLVGHNVGGAFGPMVTNQSIYGALKVTGSSQLFRPVAMHPLSDRYGRRNTAIFTYARAV